MIEEQLLVLFNSGQECLTMVNGEQCLIMDNNGILLGDGDYKRSVEGSYGALLWITNRDMDCVPLPK